MSDDVAALKQAVAIAIAARQLIDGAFKAAGRQPPSLAELRRLSPEFRYFEQVAPEGFVDLIERAAAGDDEALVQLEALAEHLGGGQLVH